MVKAAVAMTPCDRTPEALDAPAEGLAFAARGQDRETAATPSRRASLWGLLTA
jgi:hypothetical protein